jgi:hypothetical protein
VALLALILGWSTDGFDTADLKRGQDAARRADSAGDCRGEVSKHNSAAARAYSEVTLRSHARWLKSAFCRSDHPWRWSGMPLKD